LGKSKDDRHFTATEKVGGSLPRQYLEFYQRTENMRGSEHASSSFLWEIEVAILHDLDSAALLSAS
jgi:hypothetical protein